jgi:hypothetical protein
VTCDRSVVFSDIPVSSTNKTDRNDITEILLKVALNIINQKHWNTNTPTENVDILVKERKFPFRYYWFRTRRDHKSCM